MTFTRPHYLINPRTGTVHVPAGPSLEVSLCRHRGLTWEYGRFEEQDVESRCGACETWRTKHFGWDAWRP